METTAWKNAPASRHASFQPQFPHKIPERNVTAMLDYRVRTFLTVCETMNYTQAAHRLNITQPAVSQHIRCLEAAYRVRLFLYEGKQLTLTCAGEILRRRLTALENDERALRAELSSLPAGIEELSLGVTMTIGEYAIVQPLARLLAAHPELNIHLRFANTQQLLHLLDAGRIQLALVEGYYPKERYAHLRFGREDFIGVCAAAHQFPDGAPRAFSDLLAERLLVREQGSGTREILTRSLALAGLRVEDFRHFLEIGNMHSILSLLEEDCGISFLYRIAAQDGIARGVLRELPLPGFPIRHDFDFLWAKESIYGGKYRRLSEELIRCRG